MPLFHELGKPYDRRDVGKRNDAVLAAGRLHMVVGHTEHIARVWEPGIEAGEFVHGYAGPAGDDRTTAAAKFDLAAQAIPTHVRTAS